MSLTGDNGILNKGQKSAEETNMQTALEKMNLKIIHIQMDTYVEKQQMPTLQDFADALCEDEEMQYVITKGNALASLLPYIDTKRTSLYFC